MLETVEAIIEGLGGPAAAASLAGVGMSAISNWKARGYIPAEHFFVFADALGRNGKTAAPAAFGFKAEVRA